MPELIWDSKNLALPDPLELAVDSLVFPGGQGYQPVEEPVVPATAGRLIWGDNLGVMAALLPELEGRINLIYVDPPFFTNRRFTARIGRAEDSRRPQDWLLADGYADAWPDLDAYLDMLYPRLVMMHRMLAPDGTLYLHLDWHANAYARLLLDEIFGAQRMLNEIVWVYHGPSPIRTAFNRKHDTLLVYTKGPEYTFNVDAVRTPYDPNTVKTFASSPKAGFGKQPDLERGKVPEDWWYFPVVARLHNERTGYPTQKPEALLERIILAASHPGDLVADFFCGSGTTPLMAQRLGRRYVGVDAAWRAIHTTRTRLVAQGGDPFELLRPAGVHPPVDEKLDVQIELTRQAQDRLNARLSSADISRFTYWEIDPDWDGAVFHSANQAVLPVRRGEIPRTLAVPTHTANRQPTGLAQAAVRVLANNGAQTQLTLEIPQQ